MKKVLLLLLLGAMLVLTAFRNPPGVLRYVEMADKSFAAGEKELALEYYAKAVALEPENPGLYSGRGFLLLKLKRYDDARKDFSEWIRLEPQKPTGYLSRGFVSLEMGQTREADADFAAACRLGDSTGCNFAAQK